MSFREKDTSDYKYLTNSIPEYANFRYVWEPLDYLTMNTAGFNCFLAASPYLVNTAPVFGSRLQNRVANLHPESHGKIDAYLYFYANRVSRLLANRIVPDDVSIDKTTTIHDVLADNRYVMVSHSESGCLILSKSVFRQRDTQYLLKAYYLDTWPDAIKAARLVFVALHPEIPVVTSSRMGYGLRYLDADMLRVVMTLEGMEFLVASKMTLHSCYTFEKPLSGYASSQIAVVEFEGKEVPVYLNRSHNATGNH